MALKKTVSAQLATGVVRRSVAAGPQPGRKHDAERTKQDILEVATAEFAENGLSGARVDTIAARISTSKRMIYYYFGSKEGLYLAILERAYGRMRAAEQELDLMTLPPREAIRRLVEYQFEYEEAHPEFVRLVSIENIHGGKYIAQSQTIRDSNASVIDMLEAILKRGRREGVFHATIDPIDLHWLIIGPCMYRVSNRSTFGTLFGRDLFAPAVKARHKQILVDSIIGYLEGKPKPSGPRVRGAQNRQRRRV